MVDINLLDKALNYVREKGLFSLYSEDNPDFTKDENEYLMQALQRIEADGFIYSEKKYQYLLSFNGVLALDDTFFFRYKNRPYRRAQFKAAVMNFWLFIKIAAVFMNALLLLVLAVLTFLVKD